MISIKPATAEDHLAISLLVGGAFGQPNEARLIDALRKNGDIAHELVAVQDDAIVGHICLSGLQFPQGWLALAPVSVRTSAQGKGIGGELVRYGLDAARQAHSKAVVVVGDPEYYHRFGFVFGGPSALQSPYPEQYTGLFPIAPETATAKTELVYPQPFADV